MNPVLLREEHRVKVGHGDTMRQEDCNIICLLLTKEKKNDTKVTKTTKPNGSLLRVRHQSTIYSHAYRRTVCFQQIRDDRTSVPKSTFLIQLNTTRIGLDSNTLYRAGSYPAQGSFIKEPRVQWWPLKSRESYTNTEHNWQMNCSSRLQSLQELHQHTYVYSYTHTHHHTHPHTHTYTQAHGCYTRTHSHTHTGTCIAYPHTHTVWHIHGSLFGSTYSL